MNQTLRFSPSPSLSVVVLFLLFFVQIPQSLSNNNLYDDCSNQFECGSITANFPFWGNSRPVSCGIPQLNLTCDKDVTKIVINDVRYQVLNIDPSNEIFTIAREDYLNGICSLAALQFTNSTFDPLFFEYVPNYRNITIIYGCPSTVSFSSTSVKAFICNIDEANNRSGYVMEDANGPGNCNGSAYFPVSPSTFELIRNTSTWDLKLKEGFEMKWKVNKTACSICTGSDGVCGYDSTSNQTTCYCQNQAKRAETCSVTVSATGSLTAYATASVTVSAIPSGQEPLKISPRPSEISPRPSEISPPPSEISPPPSTISPRPSKISVRVKIFIGVGVSVAVAAIIVVFVSVIRIREKKGLPRGKGMIIWWKNAKRDEKIEAFIKEYRALTVKRYPYSEVKKMTNSFKDKLGGGGFGNVYKGKLQDGRLVAVKVLNKTESDAEDFINEVSSISRTSHVNVVTLLGFCYERTKRALIYEYMPNGSLENFIYSEKSPHLNKLLEWRTLYEIAVGIARGLEYLHRGCNTRIVHFDIKPHNVLLDQNFCPKISDFGLAKLCKREQSKLSLLGIRGTTGYIAPEVIFKGFVEISYKSDVYSYGMMVLEMAGRRKNVDVGVSHTSEIYFPDWIYKHLESRQALTLHEGITEQEEETVRKMIIVGLWCIQTNPSDRPSMTKVVEMLEGSLQSLQIPPKPSLFASASATPLLPQECSSTSLS